MSRNAHRLILGGLVVAGCLLTPASAGDKKADHGAVKPADRLAAKGWKDRHEKFLARAKKGGVDVLFLGDSRTQGWERAGKKAWAEHFEPLKAANFGIGGDQTGHVLWRITEGRELEGIAPKVVVLMIGTNNTREHSAEQIAGGIEAVVKTVHEKCPKTKILLLGVFPRDPKPGTKNREKIAKINDIISKLDNEGKTVKYLDIGQKFLADDGTLTKEVMPDALHPNEKGYQIWADAIDPTLKELMK